MKVRDFKGFMANKAVNEQEEFNGAEAGMYGANPEDEFAEEGEELEGEEDLEGEEEEEEMPTIEDLKAMYDDLAERVSALEPEEEEEGEEGEEDLEGEEGEEEEAAE